MDDFVDWAGEDEDDALVPRGSDVHSLGRGGGRGAGLGYAPHKGLCLSSWCEGCTAMALDWYAVVAAHSQGHRFEVLKGAVVRLYYSRLTAFIYLATLLVAAVLLLVTLGLDTPLRDAPRTLTTLETVVTLSLFVEVSLRAVVVGREYFQSWSNVADAVIAVASAALMFWAAPRASRAEDFEKQKEDVELSQSLVMARTLMQFVRVLLIAQHARRSRQASASEDITFSELIRDVNLDTDLDFSVLREMRLQEMHRAEDFGL
eukprot:NODE_10180_length_1371_cov_3.975080.p1 GENE.NODE_10180_length_1371_cov_3.975080~~NODE_10180_length_1371_cov_3.975080.p1  ORF type:complete len:261 (-),score=103.87 NODE_10180_length_1371_cov_3.975080:441-1223(-)